MDADPEGDEEAGDGVGGKEGEDGAGEAVAELHDEDGEEEDVAGGVDNGSEGVVHVSGQASGDLAQGSVDGVGKEVDADDGAEEDAVRGEEEKYDRQHDDGDRDQDEEDVGDDLLLFALFSAGGDQEAEGRGLDLEGGRREDEGGEDDDEVVGAVFLFGQVSCQDGQDDEAGEFGQEGSYGEYDAAVDQLF